MAEDTDPRPLQPRELPLLTEPRRLLFAALKSGTWSTPIHPLDAFLLVYGAVPARRTTEIVQRLLADRSLAIRGEAEEGADSPGFLYVFRDRRDPATVVKIGQTKQRNPARRIAQWRNELSDPASGGRADGETTPCVLLLFAYATNRPRLVEALVHELLRYAWRPARYSARSGLQLVEYFTCPNLHQLRALVRTTIAYVTSTV